MDARHPSALSDDDRRALFIFAGATISGAQHTPQAAQTWMLDRAQEALDLAGDVAAIGGESPATLRAWITELREG